MLYVENVTRGVRLVEAGRVANNPWTRLKGLIGVRSLEPGDGLAIKPCNGVHCFFMSIPIDVVYVSADDRVVDIDANMQPWTVGRVRRGVRYVLELPAGHCARTGTVVGDQLSVNFV